MFVIFFFFLSWNFNALVNTRRLLKPTAVKRMQFFVTIVCVLHSLSFLELFVPPRCSAIYIHQSAANAIWNGSKTINLLKPPKAKYSMPVILAVNRTMHNMNMGTCQQILFDLFVWLPKAILVSRLKNS